MCVWVHVWGGAKESFSFLFVFFPLFLATTTKLPTKYYLHHPRTTSFHSVYNTHQDNSIWYYFFMFLVPNPQELHTINKVVLKLLVSVSPRAVFYAGVFLQSHPALLAASDSCFQHCVIDIFSSLLFRFSNSLLALPSKKCCIKNYQLQLLLHKLHSGVIIYS